MTNTQRNISNIHAYIFTGLTITTVFSGLILSSSLTSATSFNDSVVDEINITVPISCSLTGTGMNTHNAEIPNGTYTADIGTTTLKAFCNDNEGFAIYAAGYTGNEIGGNNSNKLVGTAASSNATIVTGTATSAGNPDISNWAMKLSTVSNPTPTYPIVIAGSTDDSEKEQGDPDFSTYTAVPNAYTKVAYRTSATDIGDNAEGATLTTTYAAYISKTQAADTYSGQVIYTLVHPSEAEAPASPQPTTSGQICYYANTSTAVGTMGCQIIGTSDDTTSTSATLLASNFSRAGYGFAGWSDAYDYVTNNDANFYGPNEDITFTEGQFDGEQGTNNGLSLYAVWVPSVGSFQDLLKVSELCGTGQNSLNAAPMDGTANLSSVSALTDSRDNQTYAIAKLADGKCWMIENLRLDNTSELTVGNTNNPLNDGTDVTLKHNYTDTVTYNTLSATSSESYNADTRPNGWCTADSAACFDQSRLNTENTASRASYPDTNRDVNIYSYGNYYNWYSATAGRGTYSFGTNNDSTVGDICPIGWHIPRGGDKNNAANSDVWTLVVTTLNNGVYPANYDEKTQPTYSGAEEAGPINAILKDYPNNNVYSGNTSFNLPFGRGNVSNYWTSTARAMNRTYIYSTNRTYVGPGTSQTSSAMGFTVRCVVSGR